MEQGTIGPQDEEHVGPSPGALGCLLPGPEYARRLEAVLEEFSRGLEEIEELPDGYALRFPGSERWIEKLVEFAKYERDCCPFFAFELAFEPAGGALWLRLRGPEVKAYFETVHGMKSGVSREEGTE